MKRVVFIVLAMTMVISLMVLGCSNSKTTATSAAATGSSSAENVILIGDIEHLTGVASDQLKPIGDGVMIAQDYINNKGGVVINGKTYKLKVLQQDNKMSTDATTAAVNSLIFDKKCNFIIGSMATPIIKTIHTVTEANKVIYITCYNTGTAEEYGAQTPYQFVGFDGSLEIMRTSFDYLKKAYPEVKTIASVNVDDGQLKEMDVHIQKLAAEYGYTISESVGWTHETVDFTPTVQKALALNCDAIMTGNGSTECSAQVLRIAREMGYTKPIFAWNYAVGADILTIAGTQSSTNWFGHGMTATTPNKPALAQTISDIAVPKYGKLDVLQLAGFTQLYYLTQAIEQAQSLDTAAVKTALETIQTVETPLGTGKVGGLQTYGIAHSLYHPVPMNALQDGKVVDLGFFETTCP